MLVQVLLVLVLVVILVVLVSEWRPWEKEGGVVEDAAERMAAEAASLVLRELGERVGDYREELGLTAQVKQLLADLNRLEMAKANLEEGLERERRAIEEDFAMKEREIEHATGLLRKQVEQDLELGKREAVLGAREAALVEQRKAFEEKMEFVTSRFEKEGEYTRELVVEMLERLPTARTVTKLTGEV